MAFITVSAALLGLIGVLLWFTGWAEERVIEPDSETVEAKSR